MKTIGIKLADGSFYPILEDNTPSEKQLELTTAHNNQTKVMVDLYRSATCSMDDAEYVDSLQIENLTARPNGETDIKFSISLDEDNQLSAKIVDPETGNESNTTITLVSRTLEERLLTDDYAINDSNEKDGAGAVLAGAAVAGGLLAAAAALKNNKEETADSEEIPDSDETVNIDESAVEDSELTLDETAVDEPVVEEDIPTTEESSDLGDMNFDLPDDTSDNTVVEPVETTADDTDFSDLNLDLPNETSDDSLSDDTTISDETINSGDTIEDDSELPDMNFDIPDENSGSDDTITSDETITTDDTFTEEDSGLPDMNFDLPDDTTETTENDNLDMPDDFFNTEDTMKDSTFDTTSPAAGLNFDGLYDEETERGTPAQNDEDDVKKKTKVPVIICIVCAVICVLATLLILFIIPSKYNLITKKTAKDAGTTVAIAEQPAPEPSPAPAPQPEPAVPEAKEDEIVIIEKAEEVVPKQPPVAEEKPKDITYKIKWGDTLWDIADTYYKNPWRYKYIARYNGINNPDYIISGTKIVIPAE